MENVIRMVCAFLLILTSVLGQSQEEQKVSGRIILKTQPKVERGIQPKTPKSAELKAAKPTLEIIPEILYRDNLSGQVHFMPFILLLIKIIE